MATDISVVLTTKDMDGFCNGCYRKDKPNYPVYQIEFRNISFRVCEDCKAVLVDKLNDCGGK